MDNITKESREILKLVDQLVKSNNLEKALEEVRKARELDPKNIYAFAYEERIKELIAQKKEQTLTKGKQGAESLLRASPKEQPAGRKGNIPELYEEFKRMGMQSLEEAKETRKSGATKEALEIYKQALLLAWSDGQKSKEEERELEELRKSLQISKEEQETLDRQARLECYITLLKYLLQSNTSKTEIANYLAELRRSFDVSNSEHDVIEANLSLYKIDSEAKRSVVVIDDDRQLLALMKELIEQAQFQVKAFLTSDEAYEYLKKAKADCILCDISLETSTMNGFVFYEKVREMKHLQQVPFIFITALNDVVLMRIGKEMGVDDFLIKPFQRENLIATIRGKIKRYEQMRLLTGV